METNSLRDIGARIRKARERHNMTQKQLGEAISRTESSIAKYERGKVEIPYNVLQRLAKVLEVDVPSLYGSEHGALPLNWKRLLCEKIMLLGYPVNTYIGLDNTEDETWIVFPEGQLKLHDKDLFELSEALNSYTRFLLSDMREKRSHGFFPNEGEHAE